MRRRSTCANISIKPRARRLRHVADRGLRRLGVVGQVEKHRLVQEQRDRLAVDARDLRASQSNCSASNASPEFITSELRPMKRQPAASNDQWSSPMMSRNCWRCCFRDRRLRRRPDRGRIVADVVIAGNVAAGDGQGVVQALGEFDIVAARRPVEGDVAGVDDEVGPVSVDVLADAIESWRSGRESAGRDACRKSG